MLFGREQLIPIIWQRIVIMLYPERELEIRAKVDAITKVTRCRAGKQSSLSCFKWRRLF